MESSATQDSEFGKETHSEKSDYDFYRKVAGSLVVHLIILALFLFHTPSEFPAPEKPIQVELVNEAETKPEKKDPPQEKTPPLPEQSPAPKPAPIPAPEPPLPKSPEPKAEPTPITKPQLKKGKLVRERKSTTQEEVKTGKKETASKEKSEAQLVEEIPPAPEGEPLLIGKNTNIQEIGDSQLTQTERDYILSQILKYWRFTYRVAEARELTLTGTVLVLANGMLAPPFAGDTPWNPERDMPQYKTVLKTGNELYRRALESFYRALRMAQPLDLPKESKGQWPKKISVSFHFKDVLDAWD